MRWCGLRRLPQLPQPAQAGPTTSQVADTLAPHFEPPSNTLPMPSHAWQTHTLCSTVRLTGLLLAMLLACASTALATQNGGEQSWRAIEILRSA